MAGSSSSAGLFENHEIPISISNIGGVGEHESSAGLGPAADDVLVLSAVGCNSNSNGAPSSGGSMVGPTTTAVAGAGGASQNQKKRRNVPGIGNPDAEVIALSPKSLMATNRFICEVCNKGFQREQNLQLHRRGHNLPWKLKQKSSNKDGAPVRKKVYLCPESSCVHHDPSRALGDLTGIKKHFYRKHGEKKFKCDKCSKKYAVQSDWKAHRKTCGTREYRCDCGTVFSRRDSFVTHRAFCDVITREALNHPTTLTAINGGSLFPPSTAATASMGLGLSQQLHHNLPSSSSLPLQIQSHQNPNNDHLLLNPNVDGSRSKYDHLLHSHMGSAFHPMTTTTNIYNPTSQNGYATQLHHHHHHQLGLQMQPTEHTAEAGGNCGTTLFSSNNINGFFSSPSSHIFQGDETAPNLFSPPNNIIAGTSGFTSLFPTTSGNIHQQPADITTTTPHMSATALLQKAAQIGSTSSNQHPNSILKSSPASHSTTNKPPPPSTYGTTTLFDPSTCTDNIQEFINTLNGGTIFSSTATSSSNIRFGMGMGMPESDRLTRDFLGVGEQQHQGIDFIMARGTAGLHNTPTPTHTNNISNAPPPAGHHNFDRDH